MTSSTELTSCPVCTGPVIAGPILSNAFQDHVTCKRCGPTITTSWDRTVIETARERREGWFGEALSYRVRQLTGGTKPLYLADNLLANLIHTARLPGVIEQGDNLILWLGSLSADPSEAMIVDHGVTASVIGANGDRGVVYIIEYCKNSDWVLHQRRVNFSSMLQITPLGWQRYEELTRARVDTNRAFMAMQFNNPHVHRAFEAFQEGAKDAGFDLRILSHDQGAGLIDNQMRAALRTARFLVADLSTGNRGAYWEAGFAEGLGRPVIYVCEASVLADKNHLDHPHFDTNHMVTIPWDAANLNAAKEALTATIRNTFPSG